MEYILGVFSALSYPCYIIIIIIIIILYTML